MDINHLHLAVSDLPASRHFYETYLGFRERTQHGPILFLENTQGFDLALDPAVRPEPLPKWFHFGVRLPSVEAIHALYQRVSKEPSRILRKLEEHPGHVFFHAVDPDGYKIEVYWEE